MVVRSGKEDCWPQVKQGAASFDSANHQPTTVASTPQCPGSSSFLVKKDSRVCSIPFPFTNIHKDKNAGTRAYDSWNAHSMFALQRRRNPFRAKMILSGYRHFGGRSPMGS